MFGFNVDTQTLFQVSCWVQADTGDWGVKYRKTPFLYKESKRLMWKQTFTWIKQTGEDTYEQSWTSDKTTGFKETLTMDDDKHLGRDKRSRWEWAEPELNHRRGKHWKHHKTRILTNLSVYSAHIVHFRRFYSDAHLWWDYFLRNLFNDKRKKWGELWMAGFVWEELHFYLGFKWISYTFLFLIKLQLVYICLFLLVSQQFNRTEQNVATCLVHGEIGKSFLLWCSCSVSKIL